MAFWDFNIARLTYAKIHTEYGGPIVNISCKEVKIYDHSAFEAYASLDSSTLTTKTEDARIYGAAHGSGTSVRKDYAVYAAISEALERWAWYHTSESSQYKSKVGLDIDSSTSGFAAFPSFFHFPARTRANAEAAERWALKAWWENKIDHKQITLPNYFFETNAIELLAPIHKFTTIIMWKPVDNFFAYGFASSPSKESALWRASIELHRNIQVLKHYYQLDPKPQLTNRNEARLVYFSGADGHADFQRRLARKNSKTIPSPNLLVDTAISGPWDKYTKVWRCLFDPQDLSIDSEAKDYFLF